MFVAVGAVLILAILALGATSSVMQELRLARAVSRTDEAYYAMQAALAIADVVGPCRLPTYISLNHMHDDKVVFGDQTLLIRRFDEAALLPLRQASAEELARLPGLQKGRIANDLAEAVIFVKEDARRVSGVTPELYAQFAPFVTIFSSGQVNINTSPPTVLAALGMAEGLIQSIQKLRAGPDKREGTTDDHYFAQPETIAAELQKETGISESEAAMVAGLVAQGKLGVNSYYIRFEAFLVRGDRTEKAGAVVVFLPTWRTVAWLQN